MKAVRITSPPCAELDASSSGSRQSPLPAFGSSTIDRRHLERLAIVYVRQSDPHQVLLHRESKELQYNLADRAVSLGWPRERVLIIDEDSRGHPSDDSDDAGNRSSNEDQVCLRAKRD